MCVYIYVFQNNVQYRTNYNTLNSLCTAALYDTYTCTVHTERSRLLPSVKIRTPFLFASQFALRCHFAATCLSGLRVRIPLAACISLSCDCCVFRQLSLRSSDSLSREALPNVCRFFVTEIYRPHRTRVCMSPSLYLYFSYRPSAGVFLNVLQYRQNVLWIPKKYTCAENVVKINYRKIILHVGVWVSLLIFNTRKFKCGCLGVVLFRRIKI